MEINYAPAFWIMGLCYKGGIGVEKDLQKSQELIERSALLGYTYAAEDLAKSAIKDNNNTEAKNGWKFAQNKTHDGQLKG